MPFVSSVSFSSWQTNDRQPKVLDRAYDLKEFAEVDWFRDEAVGA
jgi:hypothetical protein